MNLEKDPKAKENMRIRLVNMIDDPNPVAPGTEGTIRLVDDSGVIHVNWDDGRTLGVIPGIDKYQLLESSGADIKTAIKKTSSNVNKSMPKSTKVSSSTQSSLKSSGVKTDGVKKNFKSANIKDIKVESNEIKGGKADNLTIKDLAKKHKVDVETIKKEVKTGIKVEKEHVGNDVKKAKEIAMDHVFEFPDFYSNKKYGALTSEKGLKKTEKIKTETTAAAGGASTGAYDGNAWGKGPLTKNKGVAKPGPIKEATTTYDDDISDSWYESWADTNHDGWKWNDKPFWKDGKIVDPLAKIKTVWDDDKLDISKEWDKTQSKKSLKKEDLIKLVKSRLNESKHKIVNDKKLDSVKDNFKPPVEDETLEETTTFSSVWGVNGPPVGPAFAARKGQWNMIKKPIWKGGTIVQKDINDDVLNPINERDTKFVKGAKNVKIKEKCKKYPYCSQGAIDKPIILSDETIKNIHEISKETGKPFNEVYKTVYNQLIEK